MHGVRTQVGDIFIPIPAGWTVSEAPGAPATVDVLIEGSPPDRPTSSWRPPRKDIACKIVFTVDMVQGVIEHTARVVIKGKQQKREWDGALRVYNLLPQWESFGSGGRRRADNTLKGLAEGGRTL